MDSSNRRPCYVEDDNGLASIAGCNNINNTNNLCYNNNNNNNNNNKMYNQNDNGVAPILMMRRRNSLKNMSCISSPPLSSLRSGAVARGFDPRFEDHSPHFLEACFLCRKPLGDNRDIFMYRGDTPFCSEECRQEQIEKDEAKEKSRNFKAMRNKKDSSTSSKSTSPSSSPQRQNYPFRTGTVAAA